MKFMLAFTSMFILAGAWVLSRGINDVREAHRSKSWPATDGFIKHSKLSVKSDRDSTTYSPDILYEYRIGEKLYHSNRVQTGGIGSGNPTPAERIVHKYPPGTRLKVYYNPQDPFISLLEPGVVDGAYNVIAFGSVFLLFSLTIFVFVLLGDRRKVDPHKLEQFRSYLQAKANKEPQTVKELLDPQKKFKR